MTIKILLADDHKIFRQGLRALITEQPDMTVVAEAEDGRAAVQQAAKLIPDVVIMDISMPGMDGVEATRRILAAAPSIKVLALSMHLNKRAVFNMLNAGAVGYLLKDCAFEELIEAIDAVSNNRTHISPMVTDVFLKDYLHRISTEEINPLSSLTPKERETLQLLAEGKKPREIAEILKISMKTAESHRQHIMAKLNIHNIADLIKLAIREGLTAL